MENKKIKIGLALGGGASLGFAHVGVIKALEENRIEIDYISGTSFGAMVAALYAFSASVGDLEREAEALKKQKVLRAKISKSGLASNAIIEKTMRKYVGKADISEADIPLAIVATDIENGKKAVLKKGDAVRAVLASSALPGLFSPVEIDGQLMVDGGLMENLPLSPHKDWSPDLVIAVNLVKYRKYEKPKNIIDVLINSYDIVNHRPSAQPVKEKNLILIEPDLSGYKMNDFNKWEQIADLGYKEAQKAIAEIKKFHPEPAVRPLWKKVNKIIKKIL